MSSSASILFAGDDRFRQRRRTTNDMDCTLYMAAPPSLLELTQALSCLSRSLCSLTEGSKQEAFIVSDHLLVDGVSYQQTCHNVIEGGKKFAMIRQFKLCYQNQCRLSVQFCPVKMTSTSAAIGAPRQSLRMFTDTQAVRSTVRKGFILRCSTCVYVPSNQGISRNECWH